MVFNEYQNVFNKLPNQATNEELKGVFTPALETAVSHSSFLRVCGELLISSVLSPVSEAIKIFAAAKFSEYLYTYCFKGLKDSLPKNFLSKNYAVAVAGPLKEEVIFRLGLMGGISLLQGCLKYNPYIRFGSNLYEGEVLKDGPVIIYPSVVDEVIYRLYMWAVIKLPCMIAEQFEIRSSLIDGENEPRQLSACRIYLPVECDILYHLYKKGVEWIEEQHEDPQYELTVEEKVEQVFLVHLSAVIFAAAHLSNPHPDKLSAAFQFSWSYIGGIVYARLTEKYRSIAPAIVAHSINNIIALYPTEKATTLVYILASRIVTYFVSTIQTDRNLFY